MGDKIVETRTIVSEIRLDDVWSRKFASMMVDEFISRKEELLPDHIGAIKISLKNIEKHLKKLVGGELKK